MSEYLQLPHYRTLFAHAEWHTTSGQIPPKICKWLAHTESLTEALQQQCANLTVEITQQGWQQAVRIRQNFAKKSEDQTACQPQWLREVLLKGDGTPWIFAQTILPEATVQAVAQEVLNLGERPIGLWLFPQKPVRKSLEWTQDPATGLYARRSQLELEGYPLAIYELFLPQFPFAPLP